MGLGRSLIRGTISAVGVFDRGGLSCGALREVVPCVWAALGFIPLSMPVSELYDTFAQDLERIRRRFAGNPRAEMLCLFLLALEREEIAAAGYRESPMVQRIGSLPVDADTRELMRHALSWIWKDEEMHAVYIRGAIFRSGGLGLRLRAIERQVSGWTGGWASSALIHTRWYRAPVSRLAAWLLTSLGSLIGRVPREVRRFLCWTSFHDFCKFSIQAERTAWLCWQRLSQLAEQDSVLGPHLANDFRRITADEDRHRQVFEILLGALDEEDRLVPGEDAHCLAKRIGAVSQYFLPRACRGPEAGRNPLGSGGQVWVARGDRPDDKIPLFRRLLDDCGLESLLRHRADSLRKSSGQLRVAIKPSFMLGYGRRDLSPIADPQLVEELCLFLAERGFPRLTIVEGRNIYDRYYDHRTVAEVARYFGIGSDRFPVVDCSEEQVPHEFARPGAPPNMPASACPQCDLHLDPRRGSKGGGGCQSDGLRSRGHSLLWGIYSCRRHPLDCRRARAACAGGGRPFLL